MDCKGSIKSLECKTFFKLFSQCFFIYICDSDRNMDISLLSKMIGELLLGRDEVGLPGLGAFLAEMVPATFSDKGFTINPPYRRVSFIPGSSEDDSLVALYAESNDIPYDRAHDIIKGFLESVKRRLIEEKLVIFPGLGRLRSTRQNNFFFITDEDLDIFPDGFGLPKVSLKNHMETDAEVREKVEELVAFVDGTAPVKEEPAEIPHPQLPEELEVPLIEISETDAGEAGGAAEAPAAQEIKEKKRRRPFPRWLKTFLLSIFVIAAVAALALAVFVILAQAAPDFIDSILYTPEELGIINYQ